MLDSMSMLMSFVGMGILYFVDDKDPTHLWFIKAAYAISFGFVALVSLLLWILAITKSAQKRNRVTVPPPKPSFFAALFGQKKQHGPPLQPTDMTWRSYDLMHLRSLVSSVLVSMCAGIGVHLYTGSVSAIIILCLVSPTRMVNSELFFVHILCYDAQGELRRPWEDHRESAADMFKEIKREMMQQMGKDVGKRRKKRGANLRAVMRRRK